ncbi:hypothetical protein MFIFM68171_05936 [Madurella fahalii]|uniref:Uncharacterized protein n=1 Tax=Madurella fahalii TaxID=1157608 RepID=A0ABQ0GD94_9PEZI
MARTRSASQRHPNSAARAPPSTHVAEADIHRGMAGKKLLRKESHQIQIQIDAATKKWQRGVDLRDLHPGQVSAGRSKGQNKKKKKEKEKALPLSTPATALPRTSTKLVRERQRRLLESEQQERQRLIKKYEATNDPSVFSSFLRPFMPSTELSEWRWDSSVERWWREDKSTGEKLWEPVDALFI